jgi:hypothetical protein
VNTPSRASKIVATVPAYKRALFEKRTLILIRPTTIAATMTVAVSHEAVSHPLRLIRTQIVARYLTVSASGK